MTQAYRLPAPLALTTLCLMACNLLTDPDDVKARVERERANAPDSCPAPLTVCGGLCVDTRVDPDHCGEACRPCLAGPASVPRCLEGRCAFSCVDGALDLNNDLGLGLGGDGCECLPGDACQRPAPACGDDTCDPGESPLVCCLDCPCPGDQQCDRTRPRGRGLDPEPEPEPEPESGCGDGTCDPGESPEGCCLDCGCGLGNPFAVCEAEPRRCRPSRWRFAFLSHDPAVGFTTARGTWSFQSAGLYAISDQRQSDPRGLLGAGQLLLDARGGIFGADGRHQLEGQLDDPAGLIALSATNKPGLVLMTRLDDPPLEPDDLTGPFEIVALTLNVDLGLDGADEALIALRGRLTFDTFGCIKPDSSHISAGNTLLRVEGGCFEITAEGVELPLQLLGATLSLTGNADLGGRAMVMTRRSEDPDVPGVGLFVLARASDGVAPSVGGDHHVAGFKVNGGRVESRWGEVTISGGVQPGPLSSSLGDHPDILGGNLQVDPDGRLDAELRFEGRGPERHLGQAAVPGASSPQAAPLLVTGQDDSPIGGLTIWLRRP